MLTGIRLWALGSGLWALAVRRVPQCAWPCTLPQGKARGAGKNPRPGGLPGRDH